MHTRKIRVLAGLMVVAVSAVGVVLADANWPSLRGPEFDGAARNASLFDGNKAGLEVGWKKALGSGYSSLAVGDGKVFAMFAAGENDVLAAFKAGSGDELWRYRMGEAYAGHDGSHDGPIASPTLGDGKVFGLSAWGNLFAVDALTGKEIWATHLVDDLEAASPHYGFGTSPILVDDVLIVEIGAGEGKTIAGFNAADGKVLWTAGNDKIDYQSPVAALIGGIMQVVAAGNEKLVGLDPQSGEVLWSWEHQGSGRGMGASSIIPVPAGDGRFLLMNKEDAATMVSVKRGQEVEFEIAELWSSGALKATYVTPVYHDGYFYGMSGRIFTCVDAETGDMKWRSREPGDGFPTLVGDKLVVITKPGSLHIIDASPDGYQEVAQLDLFDEHSWSQVAYAGGHLFARSMTELARIDVTGGADTGVARASWVPQTTFGEFLAEVESAADKSAVISGFLDRQSSFPIIEGSDMVHFLYQGEANDVGIVGDMIGFRREDPMTRIEGTDLFHYSTRLEPSAAVTYGFLVDYADEAVPDPRNPRPGDGLFGEVSWFSMPAWHEPAYVQEAPKNRQGTMETVEWESTVREGAKRTAEVYLPRSYKKGDDRYPVIYVNSGKDALEKGLMKNTLDNLIGEAIEPVIAVFIIQDEENRGDLSGADSYSQMVVEELVPLIDEKYRTIAERDGRAYVGGGTAGAVALHGVFKHADIFGRAGSMSGVFFIGVEKSINDLVAEAGDDQLVTIYMNWGTYDMRSPHEAWDMAEDNRKLWALIRAKGFRPAGGEIPQGVGWSCWRGQTGDMLAALFPIAQGA